MTRTESELALADEKSRVEASAAREAASRAALLSAFTTAGGIVGYGLADPGELGTPGFACEIALLASAVFATTFALAFAFFRFVIRQSRPHGATPSPRFRMTPGVAIASSIAGFAGTSLTAVVIARGAGVDLTTMIDVTPIDLLLGVAAAIPLALALVTLMRARPFRGFRDRQIELFVRRDLDVGWPAIVVMSLCAGTGEELLFRGAIQGALLEHIGSVAAIAVPSILFGVVHGGNPFYMAYTASVGVYLAALVLWRDNLVPAMTAHVVYDVYALAVTVKAVRAVKAASAGSRATGLGPERRA